MRRSDPPIQRRCRYTAALLLAALLAGCGNRAPAPEPGKPRRVLDSTAEVVDTLHLGGSHEQRLLAFLRSRYGAAARLDAPWQDQWDDTDVQALRPVTRQVCAHETVDTDGHLQHLLAVCQALDQAASVEPGRVDLYVLRDGEEHALDKDHPFAGLFGPPGRPLLVIAQRLHGEYGRHGAPGTVQIDRLGPQRHAFRITHDGSGRGHAQRSRTYVAVHNDRLREVALLREHVDNLATPHCDDALDDCADAAFTVDFTTTVGDSDAVEGYWPLTVRTTGQDCAGPAHAYDHLIFDPRTRTYPVPGDLQREGCGED